MSNRLFETGQAIICINDDFKWARKHYPQVVNWPRFGSRYIVRGYVCDGRCPAIVVQEMTNVIVIYSDGAEREAGFADKRFVKAPPPLQSTVTAKREKETV